MLNFLHVRLGSRICLFNAVFFKRINMFLLPHSWYKRQFIEVKDNSKRCFFQKKTKNELYIKLNKKNGDESLKSSDYA